MSLHQALAKHGLGSCRLADLGHRSQAHHSSVRTITRDGVPIRLDARGNPSVWPASLGWELVKRLDAGESLEGVVGT
jgi:hypothetical protein